jgi:hypothetical protein
MPRTVGRRPGSLWLWQVVHDVSAETPCAGIHKPLPRKRTLLPRRATSGITKCVDGLRQPRARLQSSARTPCTERGQPAGTSRACNHPIGAAEVPASASRAVQNRSVWCVMIGVDGHASQTETDRAVIAACHLLVNTRRSSSSRTYRTGADSGRASRNLSHRDPAPRVRSIAPPGMEIHVCCGQLTVVTPCACRSIASSNRNSIWIVLNVAQREGCRVPGNRAISTVWVAVN